MAEDPLAARVSAANVSRRTLLGGIAGTPLAPALNIAPNRSEWERALKAYSAAHYRYEAFLATSLRPAYSRFNSSLAQSAVRALPDAPPVNISELRERIATAEHQIVAAGGGRAEIVRARTTDPELAHFRSALADELRSNRTRARLMQRHDVSGLEERGNDLLGMKMDALRELLAIPALDWTGLLLKVRLSYQEIFRHEDHDALLGAIFADVERLCK